MDQSYPELDYPCWKKDVQMNIITKPTKAQVRKRAFEIYLQRGKQPGHAMDDWLDAEFELKQMPFHVVHARPFGAMPNCPQRRHRDTSSSR